MPKQTSANKRARAAHLEGLTPLQIESVARWIDGLGASSLEVAKTMFAYLEANPEDSAARGQIAYRRNYAQTASHIASLLRQSAAAR